MVRVLSLFSHLGVVVTTPVRSDFDTAVTEAGVNVTFKPTNSIYSFYRLAESEDVARLGPVSLERVRHAGPSGDTEDYSSDEVQDIALRVAAEVAAFSTASASAI